MLEMPPLRAALDTPRLMLAKLLLAVAALSAVGCSSDAKDAKPAACTPSSHPVDGIIKTDGTDTGDHALFVPEGIQVTPRPGNNSVFNIVAFTLREGPNGAEIYAAVKNEGDVVACNPSLTVELRDKDDQTVGGGTSGLMSRRLYRFTDGSGTIAGCLTPGESTMVAIQRSPVDIPIADVHSAVYYSTYWANLSLAATDGVNLTTVEDVARESRVAYSGTLVNNLDMPVTGPTVAVFPVNAVGRPLTVAYGASTVVLQPCDTWQFETNAISEPGAGYDAYPMGG